MDRSIFLEGPAGAGKTTQALHHIRALLDDGAAPEQILVLVPQRTLGLVYQAAFAAPDWPGGAQIDVVTLGGLARRGLDTFWPLVSDRAGVGFPHQEPVFLTIETAQYYMWGLVAEAVRSGVFDSISLTRFAIMRQTLDNLAKAAVNRFDLPEIAERLIAAWGDRHSSRPPVYRAGLEVAQRFREQCQQHNLLDFSLQIDLYMRYLLAEPLYHQTITGRYRHLVADNLEENFPVVADFIRWLWPDLDSALLVYDTDAGYRSFLGADPAGMAELEKLCDETQHMTEPRVVSAPLTALAAELSALIDAAASQPPLQTENPRAGVELSMHRFFPQMLDWTVERIAQLIADGVPPREIVVLAPFVGDALRFALTERLTERGIPVLSHRPSRAVRDEPATRAILTLLALAYPGWGVVPPVMDVADALQQSIEDLDPVRAWLLAQIVYRPGNSALGTFDAIRAEMQQRITYRVGEKYEHLRAWLNDFQAGDSANIPPDHFLRRLFGEVLAQPGYGFHTNLDAGRVIAELVESARKFRQTLYPTGIDDWIGVARDYYELVQEGLLAAQYVASWQDEEQDAVVLAPATTFVMRNRWVDYEFWLDVGSNQWWERLEQPLTHPYVLSRNYLPSQIWSDEQEYTVRQETLRRLVVGLARRCRSKIFAAIADLGEQGYEQRGPLLRVMQQIIQRYPDPEGGDA